MRVFQILAAAFLAIGLISSAAPAVAGEEVLYGPAPAWVRPPPLPAPNPQAGGAIEILLLSSEALLGPDGAELYGETAIRVLTEQGLQQAGTITQSWDPASETLTIHRLVIIRGGRTIDMLADGERFVVLRVETDLSRALLNGRLTANRQVEGLEVGDIVHVATSVRRRHVALGSHGEFGADFEPPAMVRLMRARVLWPDDRPVRWRVDPTLGRVTPRSTPLGQELIIERRNTTIPQPPPEDAPSRFALGALVEASDFGSWRDLSRQWFPLYQTASTLRADSPVRAEAERIRREHATPAARTAAALQLVQQRIRYFALTMDNGGYVPASADQTWSRRFGDCKAKTALLLALLRELGIEAEPAVVSVNFGDSLQDRLPQVAAFDHVIVLARVDGQTYWLDPTRLGDRTLADVPTPDYRYALPLTAAGAELVPIPARPAPTPIIETSMEVDVSAGLDAQPLVTLTQRYRGDAAEAIRQTLGSASHEEAERLMRESFQRMDGATVEDVDISTTEADGSVVIRTVMRGPQPWTTRPDNVRELSLPGTSYQAAFTARTGAAADIPHQVQFPFFTRSTVRVRLPRGGEGFEIVGADIAETAGGVEVSRTSRLEGALAVVQFDIRTVTPEVSAEEGRAAQRRFEALPTARDVVLRVRDYEMSLAEADAHVAAAPGRADALMVRGGVRVREGLFAEAANDYGEAARLSEADDIDAISRRSEARALVGDTAGALADADEAVRRKPGEVYPLLLRGQRLADAGRVAEGIAEIDRALAMAPDSAAVLNARCWVRATANSDLALALADCDAAIRLAPDTPGYLDSRAFVHLRAGRLPEALRDYNEALRLAPRMSHALYGRGIVRIRQGDIAGGEADIAAANAISAWPRAVYGRHGIRP